MELHLSIIQRVAFFLLRAIYVCQNILSKIFWFMTGKGIIFALAILIGKKTNVATVDIDLIGEKWRFLLSAIIKTIKINSYLSGLRNNVYSYEVLLRWTPSIPLIALQQKETKYRLYALGEAESFLNNDGHHRVNYYHTFGGAEIQGYFKIVDKYLFQETLQGAVKSSVRMKCVWLSGKEVGRSFEVRIVDNYGIFDAGGGQIPRQIYFPPRIAIWILEALISIGLTSLIIAAIYHSVIFFIRVA